MQRRAAAAYATLFLVLAAGAYGTIALADQPTVSVPDPNRSLATGDSLVLEGRSYNVSQVGDGEVALVWVNESERQTATIANGTELSPVEATWPGQAGRHVATLANGSTVEFRNASHEVRIDATADPPVVTLVSTATGNQSTSVEVGGTLAYAGNETNVTSVTSSEATLVWGDPYRVLIPNESDPIATFRQVGNGTATANFTVGDSFTYRGNEVTIEHVSADGVLVAWRGPVEHTRTVAEGDTVGIEGTEHVVHLPGDGTAALWTQVEDYQAMVEARNYFPERINGLWGVVILSGLGAVFLLGAAYLPSRY